MIPQDLLSGLTPGLLGDSLRAWVMGLETLPGGCDDQPSVRLTWSKPEVAVGQSWEELEEGVDKPSPYHLTFYI